MQGVWGVPFSRNMDKLSNTVNYKGLLAAWNIYKGNSATQLHT